MDIQQIQQLANTERDLAKKALNEVLLSMMGVCDAPNSSTKIKAVDLIVDKIINAAILEVSVIQATSMANRPTSLNP
jgi:hypothetical protein